MRVLSLCSGIGGIDLAAELAGCEIVGQVEIDPFCQAVLAKHWPHVKRMGDIKEVQGGEFGEIDCIAAGFPCQPSSAAGKRLGSADPRNLWPDVSRLVREIHPRWVVLENVPGLLSVEAGRLFGHVLWNLAENGYDASWQVYSAASVGAPHLRERVFIVAHARCQGQSAGRVSSRTAAPEVLWSHRTSDGYASLDDAQRTRCEGITCPASRNNPNGNTSRWHEDAGGTGQSGANVADTPRNGWRTWWTQPERQGGELCPSRGGEPLADSNGHGQQQSNGCICKERRRASDSSPESAGVGQADASGAGLPLWDRCAGTGTLANAAGGTEGQTQSRLGRVAAWAARWLDTIRWPARPGEPQEDWEPPRTTQERIPNRAARLKALGNAVVPAQILPIFQAIMAIEAGEVA